MEEDQDLHEEDLLPLDFMLEDDEEDNVEARGQELDGEAESFVPKFGVSLEAKLRELLRNLCSTEVKICSDASKEFGRILNEESGEGLFCLYVQSSPKCSELLEAWRLRQGKQGMAHVLSLVAAVLDHPFGKKPLGSFTTVRSLDAFARSIITQKLDDIYAELKSEESRRQSAALRLLAIIVRRGMALASELAKVFDFKLPVFAKLSGVHKRKTSKDTKKYHRRSSTRKAFVEFAMSFLQVGNPRLLRWILQQREVYSGVLRGLESDEAETIIFVLTTIRDRVLANESLLPPALRSVLFGSVTLEQLIHISGSPINGTTADLAHEVLVKVCTDPSNGLMPDDKMKGNSKRLLDLMKKLKATEIRHHKDLLLAIVEGRPSLCSLYMDAFPYNLDPSTSSVWSSAISFAADLILSTNSSAAFNSLIATSSAHQLNLDDHELQCILKCIVPCFFTRTVSTKGLLHSDIIVKHGSLRLLLEILKSLHNLLSSIDQVVEHTKMKHTGPFYERSVTELNMLPGFEPFEDVSMMFYADKPDNSRFTQLVLQSLATLKKGIQDEVRSGLPDSQVLLKLLSVACNETQNPSWRLKRHAEIANVNSKRVKSKASSDEGDIDIIIGGINYEKNITEPGKAGHESDIHEMDHEEGLTVTLNEIWCIGPTNKRDDFDILFHTKLLDALTLYLRTIPSSLEGSFDFFRILPANPINLSVSQQDSLLSLLVEYIGSSSGLKCSVRLPEMMYKHLSSLANILIDSQKSGANQAYILAKSAMLSTGAFDQNPSEIDAWLLFLPGYKDKNFAHMEVNRTFAPSIISFLCDAVSTVGNNLYRYMDDTRLLLSKLQGLKDNAPCFSPLSLCILQKSLRLLESESKHSKLFERTMISLYVSNTLIFLLQQQGDSRFLAGVINFVFYEKFGSSFLENYHAMTPECEWRPMKNLLIFAQNILHNSACDFLFSLPARNIDPHSSSLHAIIYNVKKKIKNEHDAGYFELATSLSASIACATIDDLLGCFPLLITVSQHLLGPCSWCLYLVLCLEFDFLGVVSNMRPELLVSALSSVKTRDRSTQNDGCLLNQKDIPDSIHGQSEYFDDLDSNRHVSMALSLFLKHVPFHSIFASLMTFCYHNPETGFEVLEFLKARVSEQDVEDSILSLRLLLFWSHGLRSLYLSKPSDRLERLSETCFVLVEYIIGCYMMLQPVSGMLCQGSQILTFAEAIFVHPLLDQVLSHILLVERKIPRTLHSLEDVISSSEQAVHSMDRSALRLVSRIGSFLFATVDAQISSICILPPISDSLHEAFKNILEKSLKLFRENFKLCCVNQDIKAILPGFYIFHGLLEFISPYDLLQLAHWMLCEVGIKNTGCSPELFVLSVTLHIVHSALSQICNIFKENRLNRVFLHWKLQDRTLDDCFLAEVYSMLLDCATIWKLDEAHLCLLKFVDIAYTQKMVVPTASILPFSMFMLNLIANSPVKILFHCVHKTNKTKAEILYKLVELSPLCSHFLGLLFFDVSGNVLSLSSLHDFLAIMGDWTLRNWRNEVAKENFMLLLPAALSVLTRNLLGFRRYRQVVFETIPLFYSKLLFDGFSNWKSFVSADIFYEVPDKLLLTYEEFETAFRNTLLGKSMKMLQYSFLVSNAIKMKQRLKEAVCIFDAALPDDEDALCDLDLRQKTYLESFNTVNRIFTKISFAWLLIFPPENLIEDSVRKNDKKTKASSVRKETERKKDAKVRFLNFLNDLWYKLVRTFPMKQEFVEKTASGSQYPLLRFLEISLLRNVVQLVMRTKDDLDEFACMSFVESFVKSALLYRFDDPCTLRVIHEVLTNLNGAFSAVPLMELFLGHSKFVSTMLKGNVTSDSGLIHSGTFLQSVPSILRSVGVFSTKSNSSDLKIEESLDLNRENVLADMVKLELVRVLRLVYHQAVECNKRHSNVSVQMNTRDLLSLLLCGYGASVAEVDMEIFQFIQEIESASKSDEGSVEELDYMWGGSAFKRRQQKKLDVLEKCGENNDNETFEEWSKRIFRENIAIDSRRCAITALKCSNEKPISSSSASLEELCSLTIPSPRIEHNEVDGADVYNPVFIMRLSIHCLRKGYLEPAEFARIGLLAIAFLGISSQDEIVRKLGYEVLASFRRSLANYQKSKDVLQLELLLTFLQNGITESWQKVPSMIALFAAEASFLLLDVSQDHFYTISKFLMRSPGVELKDIPLFHSLFRSSSVHYKSERMWMLRLLYAGLNTEDDAQMIIKKFIMEFLLSFYSSTLSDPETRLLILQILKKSMKLHVLARCLIEHCGIISWLYHVLLDCGPKISGNMEDISQQELKIVLEVALDVISFRFAAEWMQKFALEQLSQLSCYLHMMLVHNMEFLKENISIVNTIFLIITSNFKVSQKRKVYKPHIVLSLDGLFQLFVAVKKELSNVRFDHTHELGLKMLLMSAPTPVTSQVEKFKILEIMKWAIPVALRSSIRQQPLPKEVDFYMPDPFVEQKQTETLVSKLLRWLVASIILGSISSSCPSAHSSSERSELKDMLSLVKYIKKQQDACQLGSEMGGSINKALSMTILYLQQLLGTDTGLLSSVSLSLHLLLQEDILSACQYPFTDSNQLASLCAKIRCPNEASASWRWSFYQPWKDLSAEESSAQRTVEEEHACHTLLLMFSRYLGGRRDGKITISPQDMELLFTWQLSVLKESG